MRGLGSGAGGHDNDDDVVVVVMAWEVTIPQAGRSVSTYKYPTLEGGGGEMKKKGRQRW